MGEKKALGVLFAHLTVPLRDFFVSTFSTILLKLRATDSAFIWGWTAGLSAP